MDKQTFEDVTWLLFHELGRYLRKVVRGAPERSDVRTLLKHVIQNRQPDFISPRNPFNWLKELATTLNFWNHLQPESDIPEDDVWRDLDTLERVAKHLNLDSEFVETVHDVKARILLDKALEDREPSEVEIRSWIKQEVAEQLNATNLANSDHRDTQRGDSHRGELADRVRDFVIATYIEPARAEGVKEVRVRAGGR